MEKVKPVTLCAESSGTQEKLPPQANEITKASGEGNLWAYRSAAMVGLAISMGATGIFLPNQQKQAVAADSKTWDFALTSLPSESNEATSSSQTEIALKANLPQPESRETEDLQLAPPAVKHEVKEGETLWQLSEKYQVTPEIIAASNQLEPDTNILVGQSLKIPAVESIVGETKSDSISRLPEPYRLDSPGQKLDSEKLSVGEATTISGRVDYLLEQQQNDALKNLQQKRDRLENSLAEWRVEENKIESGNSSLTQQAEVTALSSGENLSKSVEIPVSLPANQPSFNSEKPEETIESQPVVIPVTQPEQQLPSSLSTTEETKATRPVLLPIESAPSLENRGETTTSSLEVNPSKPTQQQSVYRTTQEESQNLIAYDKPVPILVPAPENRAENATEEERVALRVPTPVKSRRQPGTLQPLSRPGTSGASMASQQVYQVKRGDTINSIARHYGVSSSELIRANRISNPNLIKLNQKLVIPSTNLASSNLPTPAAKSVASQVQSSTNLPLERLKADVNRLQQEYRATASSPETIAITIQPRATSSSPQAVNPEWASEEQTSETTKYQPKPSNQQLVMRGARQSKPIANSPRSNLVSTATTNPANYNQLGNPVGETVSPDLPILSPEPYLPDSQSFNGYTWPSKGVITSGYGWRWGRMHKGIDIAGPIGTPIVAAASGEVVFAGWNSGGYGNLVKVKHPNGSLTLYAHNSRLLVRRGQKVEQGQQIAEMGSTGYSTGPHLHFEVHPSGQGAANPVAYLPRQR